MPWANDRSGGEHECGETLGPRLVTDQSGAGVSGAKVVVTNSERGTVRDVTSGTDGSASFAALPSDAIEAVRTLWGMPAQRARRAASGP